MWRIIGPWIIIAGLSASALLGWAYAWHHDRKAKEEDALHDRAEREGKQ